MSGIEFTHSRFKGEREIYEALESTPLRVLVSGGESSYRYDVAGRGVGVDAVAHESIGQAGGLTISLSEHARATLEQYKESLRLVLVAYSVGAAVSAVLLNTELSAAEALLATGEDTFKFANRPTPTLDPLRASVTGYELYITGHGGLPVWKKSWNVKLQERKGSWLLYGLGDREAEQFGVPKDTYLYSDLENLSDQDFDLNGAKFYVNEDVFSRMHELSRAEQCLLVRACLCDIVDHLAEQEAPEEGSHSLLQSIWDAYTGHKDMEQYSDPESRLTPAGRRFLLSHVDSDLKIVSLSVENLSSSHEEEFDEQ